MIEEISMKFSIIFYFVIKIEKKVDKNEEEISSIKSFPTKGKAGKFDSIVNLIFKVFITAVVSYVCVKIGLK